MKMTEFLKIAAPMLKMLSKNGVGLDDWKYVEAYEQFLRMRGLGVKYRVAIRMLAEEMQTSRRTIERAFKRIGGSCNC